MQKYIIPSKDLVRLRHMLDSTEAILHYTIHKQRSDLDQDRLLASGLVRELEIIGEAAARISPETAAHFQTIPWKQMIGMRNRLIHAYFDIDYDILWLTLERALPPLKEKLQEILSAIDNG